MSVINFAYLDSGIGGLPYLKYLKEESPSSRCIYVADTKNFPYGQKTREEVLEAAIDCVRKIIFLYDPNVIVVACNTISVVALDDLRKHFPGTSFVGTVPAIKKAALVTCTHKIGLLATNRTIYDPYTVDLNLKFAADCEVVTRADPALIAFIEHEYLFATEEQKQEAVKASVDYFRLHNVDVIVLACTHFLNMIKYFENYAKAFGITVVDSREGVTKRALEVEKNINFLRQATKIDTKSAFGGGGSLRAGVSDERSDVKAEEVVLKNLQKQSGQGDLTGEASKMLEAFGGAVENDNPTSMLYITSDNLDDHYKEAYQAFCKENEMEFAGLLLES